MKLTPRELELAEMISKGMLNKEIAEELSLSLKTVKCYTSRLFKKTGARNRTTLASMYINRKSLEYEEELTLA